MKTLNILGLIIFSVGVLTLIGFSFYKFFENSTIPSIIRWGTVAIILGVVIILISLIKERLKEKEL